MNNNNLKCTCANILTVGAYEDHIELLHRTLNLLALDNRLHTVSNEFEATAYLKKIGPYRGAPDPDLLILEVCDSELGYFKDSDALRAEAKQRQIPVILLVNAKLAYLTKELGKSVTEVYLNSPFDLEEFSKVLNSIASLSLSIIKLDQEAGNAAAGFK